MRRILALLSSLTLLAALLAGCGGGTQTATPNGNGAAADSNGNSNGTREGTGPHSTGIGGTGEANRSAPISANSNVEPTGVNKNVGATPPAANRNR